MANTVRRRRGQATAGHGDLPAPAGTERGVLGARVFIGGLLPSLQTLLEVRFEAHGTGTISYQSSEDNH